MTESQGWLRRLTGYCVRHPVLMTAAFVGSLVGSAISAVTPLVQRTIVDNVILTHRQPLAPWAVLLLVLAVTNFAMAFLRRYLGGRLSLDVQYDLRTELFGALSRLDGARQDEIQTGQIVSRATSDITMVQGLLGISADHGRATRCCSCCRWCSCSSCRRCSPWWRWPSGPACWWSPRCRAAGCSRRPGTRSRVPARSPGSSRPRSPASGWSRASARRSRSWPSWRPRPGTCSPRACARCG